MAFPLPEKITLWRVIGNDGLGGKTYSAPETHAARMAYSQQRFTDINGDDAVSTAVCYTKASISREEVQRGIYVLLGEISTEAEPPREANDVRGRSQTPSGAGELSKLWFAT